MMSVDELLALHKQLHQSCYNYAAGRLNGEHFREALRELVAIELELRLPKDEYDYEVKCDADNNPLSVCERGGYQADLRIIEKQGSKRTFNMQISEPPAPLIKFPT